MLVRITWALVVAALGTLIGGFFTPDSNVLLFVAIGLALGVIVLVLVSWARRAREATGYAFEGRRPAAVQAEADDEELFAALERDEEFAVRGSRRARSSRRPARRSATPRPRRKPTKAKPKAKPKAKAARKSSGTAAKAKPTRKAKPRASTPKAPTPKAQGSKATRPKPRQPRPRPESP